MSFGKFLTTPFLHDAIRRLLLIRKRDIQTFDSKHIFSIDQYCWHIIFDEQKCRFRVL